MIVDRNKNYENPGDGGLGYQSKSNRKLPWCYKLYRRAEMGGNQEWSMQADFLFKGRYSRNGVINRLVQCFCH